MPFKPNPLLNLSIDWNTKGIPYPAEDHPHGSRNHGYTALKGRIHLCSQIAEARDDPKMVATLQRLNTWNTAFYTTGCERCFNEREGYARPMSYVEFVFNSVNSTKSVMPYFELYHGLFKKMRADGYVSEVGFLWNLSPTSFNDRGESGYAAVVFLQSFEYSPVALAVDAWHRALDYLASHLCEWPDAGPPYFYAPEEVEPKSTRAGSRSDERGEGQRPARG